MKVRDLMSSTVFASKPDDSVADLRDLMYEHDVRHIPVVDGEGDLVGLVSQRDLLRNSLVEQADMPRFIEDEVLNRLRVAELMTTVVEAVEPESDIRSAADLMIEYKYGCLPVVDGSRLVGILTESDFVRLMAQGC
ncbi:MAG: CBS domain-containing protein [Thermoanaerobaculia bacterium]|nr:CBS domain-containing protein [Thermoanaerobaculia bacterium]